MKKIIISLFLYLALFNFTAKPIFAQSGNGGSFGVNGNTTGSTNTSVTSTDPTCNGGTGINTAIGCIPVGDTNSFVGWILGWAVGIGGGIAFLLIVYASFLVMTSQGDPTRLKAGQEMLTSAISGLIMLIFSVFILKFIGVDILGLSSFGFGS